MEDLNIPPSPEEEAEEQEELKEKPDFVRKIESFDVKNLTPENVEFMAETIQNYFLERFPVDPELVEQLKDHISVLDDQEYHRILGELAEDAPLDLSDLDGLCDSKHHKIYINSSTHDTPGALFTTMFHESLHFVSIGAGAGFAGTFSLPDSVGNDEEEADLIDSGLKTLVEGTTHLITLSNVVGNMGFDESRSMRGYMTERAIMNAIWFPLPKRERFHAYFNMPLEELRIHVEKIYEPEEAREKIGPSYSNGTFADCLYNIGVATEMFTEAIESWGEGGDPGSVLNSVYHAVGHYLRRRLALAGLEPTADYKEYLKEYFEGEEDV